MPDVVRPSVLSKGGDVMPRPTLLTVCSFQGQGCHATPDVVRPSVFFKSGDGMPRPTSFDRVCCLKAEMLCQARCSLTVCAVQGG